MIQDSAVTVIGGYLGAGKTTLVNHILRTADQRVAVLVNDFGDIDIDAALIESADGDTISLANGCICCSLVDGLAAALTTIKELDPRPERLVIEASGVADPASIAAYGHSSGLSLDAVVVVVDAETVRARSADKYVGDTVLTQLRSADILVLNKIDLVDSATADATRAWLRDVIPTAVIVDSEHAEVAPALLFGAVEAGDRARPIQADGGHDEHDHRHGEDLFESWSWAGDEPLERATIERLMAALPEAVVRAKGVVSLLEDPDRAMVLQRVGGRWTLRPRGPWAGRPTSQIVVIGMKGAIDDGWLSDQLA
ncbi:MAG: CobW family GTP-binding protein [Acidimicrobiales bacterium]